MSGNKFYMSDSFSDFPSYVERSSPKPKLFLIFILVFLLVIAALAGLYFLGANKNSNLLQSGTATPSPTIVTAPIPTATPVITQPPIERSELTVSILNGSGTAGAARGISSYLNGLGYTIGPIGNADNFSYTGLTIHVKQARSAYLKQLEDDLKKYNPGSSVSASVDDSIATEAEVIVGK